MIENSSIALIKKKVSHGFYDRTRDFDVSDIMEELRKDPFYDKFPDDQLIEYAIEKGIKDNDKQIELIVSNLKNQDKFKNFTDDQLYEYAYGIKNRANADMHAAKMHSFTDHSRPNDPVWGQYTYEEILQMEAEGVNVPEEFLEWAHGMQDANTTDFQVKEDGSDEQNTVENLDNGTNNDTQASVQKKAQAFSSQAEAQQNLIENECEDAQPLAQAVSDRQEELISEQKNAMQDADDMMREWKNLDEKAQNGTLTENEKRRYEELSKSLSNNNNNLSSELDNLSNDIDELMSHMDKITMLIDVNDKINTELEDTSVRAAFFEGDKNRGYLGNKKDLGNFSTPDTMKANAMGANVGKNTALSGLLLNSNNVDIKRTWDTNIAIGEAAETKLADAQELVKDAEINELNSNVTPRPVDTTEETEQPSSVEQTPLENNAEDTIVAMAPVEIAQENDDINTINKPEAQTETETEPEPEPLTIEDAGSDNSENISDTTAQQDPMQTLTSEYISACSQKQSEMDNAGEEVKALLAQVKEIQSNKFADTVKINLGFKSRIKEYENLANKSAAGQELSSSELARISQLESYLDTDNGEVFVSLQGKINTLNSYTMAVDNLNQLSDSNKVYGEQAVAQGKTYAVSQMGDRSNMLLLKEGNNIKDGNPSETSDTLGSKKADIIMLNKSKRYDMLYGKSGESLGRDLIDSGEALITSSSKNLKNSKNIINKSLSSFANDYAQKLGENLTGMAASVSPLKSVISAAIAKQNAKKEEEKQQNNIEQNDIVQNNTEAQVLNNKAVPEPQNNERNAEIPVQNTTADTVNNNSEQQNKPEDKNPQNIEVLNSKSETDKKDNEPTTVPYNSTTTTLRNDNENNQDEISLNAKKISSEDKITKPEENTEPEKLTADIKEEEALLADEPVEEETEKSVEEENVDDANEKDIQEESIEDTNEEPLVEDTVEEEPQADTFVEADGLPLNINENSTENDLETVCLDSLANDSEENAEMLKDNGTKLSMEKLAREAAVNALAENNAKGGFNASASASASVGAKLGSDNTKTESGRARRFKSYENKNRRAALADKVENSKKVLMKRGKNKK